MQNDLNGREKEVLECLLSCWTRDEFRLYGNLSYQDVFDLMAKLGVDSSGALEALEDTIESFDAA